jgi:hypothetical protein
LPGEELNAPQRWYPEIMASIAAVRYREGRESTVIVRAYPVLFAKTFCFIADAISIVLNNKGRIREARFLKVRLVI